jgi:hypothetical protein
VGAPPQSARPALLVFPLLFIVFVVVVGRRIALRPASSTRAFALVVGVARALRARGRVLVVVAGRSRRQRVRSAGPVFLLASHAHNHQLLFFVIFFIIDRLTVIVVFVVGWPTTCGTKRLHLPRRPTMSPHIYQMQNKFVQNKMIYNL